MKHLFGWIVFIAVAVMLFMLLQNPKIQYPTISLSDFRHQLEADRVRNVVIENDQLLGEFAEPQTLQNQSISKFRVILPEGTTSQWQFTDWLTTHRGSATVTAERNPDLLMNILVPLIPWLLIFGFIWFFVFRQLRSQKGKLGEPIRVVVVNPNEMTPTSPRRSGA
jgi:ATP-dependent Zn protease